MSGSNPDAIDEEKGVVCQTPATINKKEPACSVAEQAGVPIDRVIGLSRERILIANVWSMLFYYHKRPCRLAIGVNAKKFCAHVEIGFF
jgi:hypothetical protein